MLVTLRDISAYLALVQYDNSQIQIKNDNIHTDLGDCATRRDSTQYNFTLYLYKI